ncbi:MAG: tRNA (adenosine(37)-N6)-threonylcarbamoyltransferase complex ATPase subunit type 1 TsaE [Acidimicrobiales bacterium]
MSFEKPEVMALFNLATKSVEDTKELAGVLAASSRPGDVILLVGELGAGKTAFAQGFGRGMGILDPITSPTFTLVRIYRGEMVLLHVDIYRLASIAEVEDLALGELLDAGGVALVEWGDMAASVFAPDFLEVSLRPGCGSDERNIALRASGRSWSTRMEALALDLDRWRCPPEEDRC